MTRLKMSHLLQNGDQQENEVEIIPILWQRLQGSIIR
jgi:hypothetical protein